MSAIYPKITANGADVDHLLAADMLSQYAEQLDLSVTSIFNRCANLNAPEAETIGAIVSIYVRIAVCMATVPAQSNGAPFNRKAFEKHVAEMTDYVISKLHQNGVIAEGGVH